METVISKSKNYIILKLLRRRKSLRQPIGSPGTRFRRTRFRFRSLPASKRKLVCDVSSADEEDSTDGFGLIDITILMSIFNTFLCSKCKSAQIVMKEDITAKMGLVSQLSLQCSAEMCSYFMNFYISSRVNNKSKALKQIEGLCWQ